MTGQAFDQRRSPSDLADRLGAFWMARFKSAIFVDPSLALTMF